MNHPREKVSRKRKLNPGNDDEIKRKNVGVLDKESSSDVSDKLKQAQTPGNCNDGDNDVAISYLNLVRGELDLLTTVNADLKSQNECISKEREELVNQVKILKTKNDKLTTEFTRMQSTNDNKCKLSRDRINDLKSKNEKLEVEILLKCRDITDISTERDKVQDKAKVLETNNAKVITASVIIGREREEFKNQVGELKTKNGKLEVEVSCLTKDVEVFKNDVLAQKSQNVKLESEVNRLKSIIMQQDISLKTVDSLTTVNKDLKSQNDSISKEMEELNDQVKILNTKNENLSTEMEDFKNKVGELKDRNEKLEAEDSLLNQDVEVFKKKILALKTQNVKLESEVHCLKSSLAYTTEKGASGKGQMSNIAIVQQEISLQTDVTLSPFQSDVFCVELDEAVPKNSRIVRHPEFEDFDIELIHGEVGEEGNVVNISVRNKANYDITLDGTAKLVIVTSGIEEQENLKKNRENIANEYSKYSDENNCVEDFANMKKTLNDLKEFNKAKEFEFQALKKDQKGPQFQDTSNRTINVDDEFNRLKSCYTDLELSKGFAKNKILEDNLAAMRIKKDKLELELKMQKSSHIGRIKAMDEEHMFEKEQLNQNMLVANAQIEELQAQLEGARKAQYKYLSELNKTKGLILGTQEEQLNEQLENERLTDNEELGHTQSEVCNMRIAEMEENEKTEPGVPSNNIETLKLSKERPDQADYSVELESISTPTSSKNVDLCKKIIVLESKIEELSSKDEEVKQLKHQLNIFEGEQEAKSEKITKLSEELSAMEKKHKILQKENEETLKDYCQVTAEYEAIVKHYKVKDISPS